MRACIAVAVAAAAVAVAAAAAAAAAGVEHDFRDDYVYRSYSTGKYSDDGFSTRTFNK